MSALKSSGSVQYEIAKAPAPGETCEIIPGVDWLRMPLPFSLSHINLWLLDDGENWATVDCGVHTDESKEVWRSVFDDVKSGRPLSRILVTHLHPDHAGCAGWLCEQFDAPLWMSRAEYLLCRVLVADTGRSTPEAGNRFYAAAGFEANQMDFYHKMFGMFGKYVSALPEAYHRMQAGDRIQLGSNEWQVIIGRGHSPEHACLYCEEQNILISGDQLLPTISSNVSVFPTEPQANPLAEWLESLSALKGQVPEDVLVLPAHGKPFRGAHQRLDALIAEHQDCLTKLLEHCRTPRRAVDVFPALFKGRIDNKNLILATGESIAHLNYLLVADKLQVRQDANGVDWYCSK